MADKPNETGGVVAALLQMAVNSYAERRIIAQRQAIAGGSGFNTGIGTKRAKAWIDYGYPNTLNFWDYLNLYQRNSIAFGGINRLVDKSWQDEPWIIEGDEPEESEANTAFDNEARQLFKRLGAWQAFAEADRRRCVGTYAGLILHVADGKRWDEPLEQGQRLVKIMPAWEGQLTPTEWDNNPLSPSYGKPVMWSYQEAQVETADHPPPGRAVNIHHSRVVIVGDYREGVSMLEAPYNDFVSLEKIQGALGESYWKNAARQLNVEYDKDTNIESLAHSAGVEVADLHDALNGMFADLNQGLDAGMVSFGGKATPLVAAVPPPAEPFEVLIQSIAAAWRMPTRILVGNQQGERASTEDAAEFADRCQGRRRGELTTDIKRFVDHLMQYGLLSTVAEYTVMWTDLGEAGLSDKLKNAELMAKINQALMGTGPVAFDVDEIRAAVGYEAVDSDAPFGEMEGDEDA